MSYFNNLYGGETEAPDFDSIAISIASPEKIRAMSYGAITKPETVNYRTFNPEKDGLFCARIFGPVKSYECLCGKYKRIKYKGIVCEKCKVEVTTSRVRRERMAHIDLAAPVAHIWFVKSLPSRIGNLLDISLKDLESIIYFESYIVVNPGMTALKYGQVLTEETYNMALDKLGEGTFEADMGAEAIHKMLSEIDLQALSDKIRILLPTTNSELKKKKMIKRLRIVENFLTSNNKPEHMILKVLPVMPPDFRPLVILNGGRFATSDLTELYRRLIYRNNRLKRLIELQAPSIIIKNEKRMLQESVDAIIDNGRRTKVIKSSNNRPFKSLTDLLKGKQGRFRMHLLGKRVDYSARSVVIVGPHLRLHQCGLPKEIAFELFKPFIYHKLELYGIASTIKIAKRIVEEQRPEALKCLQEIIKGFVILLNRAPTLHRLGIQAFEPLLIDEKAIQVHPLVCAAYNMDFDGDQVAIHLPISFEAQTESRILMMSTQNILNPANGKPVILPTKDMVLGVHYLTLINEYAKSDRPMIFGNIHEVNSALLVKKLHIHTPIIFRVTEENSEEEGGATCFKRYDTTPGRAIMYDILPRHKNVRFSLINRVFNNKNLVELFNFIYINCGRSATVHFADKLMDIGFEYATKSGISFNIKDMVIPENKWKYIHSSEDAVKKIEEQYQEGLFTVDERYNKIINTWSKCIENVEREMTAVMSGDQKVENPEKEGMCQDNSIYMMARSGARGSAAQLKQLCGMRGLMTKPSGEIIETPIIANFAEGLSVLEYFISAHGARKGIADTALKTANSGYLTRRLVDVAQDFVVREFDCGSKDFQVVEDEVESGEVVVPVHRVVIGYTVAEDLMDQNGEIFLPKNEIIDEDVSNKISQNQIKKVKVRSVMTCKVRNGTCVKCYGRDLGTGQEVDIGLAVGIVAAQSIGEPGTQLTMRTFHVGGATTGNIQESHVDSTCNGKVKFQNKISLISDRDGDQVVIGRNFSISIFDDNKIELENFILPYGAKILVKDGGNVEVGVRLAIWDPYTTPIIAECTGKVQYNDLLEDISYSKVVDDTTGVESLVVQDWRSGTKYRDLHPAILIVDNAGNPLQNNTGFTAKYLLPIKAVLNVHDGDEIHAGDIITFVSARSTNVKDITGGLPRVSELFEARKGKNNAIISAIDGVIGFGKDYRLKRSVIVRPMAEDIEPVEYLIPKGSYIAVNEGDLVKKGDLLMNGTPDPHEILRILGVKAFVKYMIGEIQGVYRMQGVEICNKHIEVILRQMLRKVRIIDPGDAIYLEGEIIDLIHYEEINAQLRKDRKTPMVVEKILYGITKSSLSTKSFIAAASFQETTKVLTEAAVVGKVDHLEGIKENVLVGSKMIPAGTGFFINQWKKGKNDFNSNDYSVDNATTNSNENVTSDAPHKNDLCENNDAV